VKKPATTAPARTLGEKIEAMVTLSRRELILLSLGGAGVALAIGAGVYFSSRGQGDSPVTGSTSRGTTEPTGKGRQ